MTSKQLGLPIGHVWANGSQVIEAVFHEGRHRLRVKCGQCCKQRLVTVISERSTGLCAECNGRGSAAKASRRYAAKINEEVQRRIAENQKNCTSCGLVLPLERFSRRAQAKDGYNIYCRSCAAEKIRACLYGFAPGEHTGLVQKQDGKCAIKNCDRPLEVVDHCHNSGKVRGLLCAPHNTVLHQHFTADDYRNMADYLENNLSTNSVNAADCEAA